MNENEQPEAKKPVRKRPPRKPKAVAVVPVDMVVVEEQPEPEPEPEPLPKADHTEKEQTEKEQMEKEQMEKEQTEKEQTEKEQTEKEQEEQVMKSPVALVSELLATSAEEEPKAVRRVTINASAIAERQENAKVADQVALLTDLLKLSRRERQKLTEEVMHYQEQVKALKDEVDVTQSLHQRASEELFEMIEKHQDCNHKLLEMSIERDQWQRLFQQADSDLHLTKEAEAVQPDPQAHILDLSVRVEALEAEKSQWVLDRSSWEQRCNALEERLAFVVNATEGVAEESRRRCVIA